MRILRKGIRDKLKKEAKEWDITTHWLAVSFHSFGPIWYFNDKTPCPQKGIPHTQLIEKTGGCWYRKCAALKCSLLSLAFVQRK